MALHLDLAAGGVRREPERHGGRLQPREEVFGVSRGWDQERARRQLDALDLEWLFGGEDVHVLQPKTKRGESRFGGRVEHETRSAVSDRRPPRHGPRRHQRHRSVEDRRIDNSQRDDVSKGAESPASVVVGAWVGGRVILGVEHHVDHPAEGLIHPHDVAARRDFLSLWFGDLGLGLRRRIALGSLGCRAASGRGPRNLDLGLTIEAVDLGPLALQQAAPAARPGRGACRRWE